MVFFWGTIVAFNGFTATALQLHTIALTMEWPLSSASTWYLYLSLSFRWSGHVSSSLVASTHHWAGYPFPWWCSPWIIDIILPLAHHCTHNLATVSQIICGEHKIPEKYHKNISRNKIHVETTKDDQLTVGLLELDKWVYQVNSPKMGEQVKISVFFTFLRTACFSLFVCLVPFCMILFVGIGMMMASMTMILHWSNLSSFLWAPLYPAAAAEEATRLLLAQ